MTWIKGGYTARPELHDALPRARGTVHRSCAGISECAASLEFGLRMQEQLLRPPVQELADPQHVLQRAGECVNPTELLELLVAFAEHAKQLAVEREL